MADFHLWRQIMKAETWGRNRVAKQKKKDCYKNSHKALLLPNNPWSNKLDKSAEKRMPLTTLLGHTIHCLQLSLGAIWRNEKMYSKLS